MSGLTQQELEYVRATFDAARRGDVEDLAHRLDQGIPVNLTNDKGDTLLILAAYHTQPEAVRLLLARSADTERVNDNGQTAVAAAVFRQDEPIVRMLLEAGADPALGARSAYAIADFFGIESMAGVLPPR